MEEVLPFGLGLDGGVNDDFAAERDGQAAFGEAEGEGSGEEKAVFAIESAAGEGDLHCGVVGGAGGDDGVVEGSGHQLLAFGAEVYRERRHPALMIGDAHAGGDGLLGGNVLREAEGEVELVESQAADDAGDQEGGDQQGEQEEQEIIGREEGGEAHDDDDHREGEAEFGDALTDAAAPEEAEASPDGGAGKIGTFDAVAETGLFQEWFS